MSKRKTAAGVLAACALSSLGLLTACGGGPPVRGAVYVDVAPPADRIEVVGVAPSGEHIWIPGHHVWSGGTYSWVAGHWEMRPRARARWVPGRWRRYQGRWYWVDGHWR